MLYNFQFHDVFERRTSTGSELSVLLGLDFEQMFGQIVSLRVKTLSNTNLVASRHMKRQKSSLPVEERRSKTLHYCLKQPRAPGLLSSKGKTLATRSSLQLRNIYIILIICLFHNLLHWSSFEFARIYICAFFVQHLLCSRAILDMVRIRYHRP